MIDVRGCLNHSERHEVKRGCQTYQILALLRIFQLLAEQRLGKVFSHWLHPNYIPPLRKLLRYSITPGGDKRGALAAEWEVVYTSLQAVTVGASRLFGS